MITLLRYLGGVVAVTCFAGAIYCAVLRGDACFHQRPYDAAAGHTEPLRCKAAGPSYGTPREARLINLGTWWLWLGAGLGGWLFTLDERIKTKPRSNSKR